MTHAPHFVTRFAPSPTGYLHIGHIASAIYVWGIAARLRASVLLRIEDHDRSRARPHFEESIFADLSWLGFQPTNAALVKCQPSVYRQSNSASHYEAALAHLVSTQKVFACQCSRKEIQVRMAEEARTMDVPSAFAPAEDDGELRYPGTCRDRGIPLDTPGVALRLALPDRDIPFTDLIRGPQIQNPWKQCGDLLLKDRHGQWTYQFAVTVDDLRHGITHVIRGGDLLASTGRQILLGSWLGRNAPAQYGHHPLIVDENGRKLGKRFFSEAVCKRREAGESPEHLLGEAAYLVGMTEGRTPETLQELINLMSRESDDP